MPRGRSHRGRSTMFAQQANSGHGQRGHRHRGRATIFLFLSAGQQRSRPTRAQTSRASYLFLFLSAGQQRSWPMRAQTLQVSYYFFHSKPNGSRATRALTCGRANSMYSKSQRSRPTRVQDIQASCVQQHAPAVTAKKGTRHCGQAASQAPAVSATEGRRHRRRASLMVAVVQKGVDGTAHDHS